MAKPLIAYRNSSRISDWIWDVLIIGFPFVVYLRTMAPTVYGLDSAELTTGAYTLGIVHPPGSPLFLLLGNLFTYIPYGDIGYRVNLLSAVSAALTIFFLYRLIYILTQQRVIAISASLFFAFTYYFWISALAAELYSLEAFFIALTIFLAVKWIQERQTRFLYALSFFFGLGLGNHFSLILLAPGLAWIVINQRRNMIRPKLILISIGFACLGASIYLYLPIRYAAGATLDYARSYWDIDLTTVEGFWWMLSGKVFSSLYWAHSFLDLPSQISNYTFMLWSNFLGLGFVFGIVGFISDYKNRTSFHLGLGLMWLGYLIFYIPYGATDKEVMFLPTYLIWSIWIGIGIWFLQKTINTRFSPALGIIAPNLLIFLTIGCLIFNFRYVDLSQDWSARQVGQNIMNTLEPDSIFFGSWIDVPILEYLQLV
ncbi:DUF2723 domain-containing protein, partial [bacterium]|nr:DUF2723 domain-containing protein [bacterium]